MTHSGSCLCGRVKFETEGDFENFFLCHCEHCRKDTGSAHSAALFTTTAKLEWLSGEENVKTFNHNGHIHSFCKECGSALPALLGGGMVMVPAGSLDTDVTLRPNGHIYCSHKANWDNRLEEAADFDELPK